MSIGGVLETSTMRIIQSALLGLVMYFQPLVASADLVLVMVEQPGCVYCQAWNAELAPIYAKTAEGRAAPLIRHQLRAAVPDGMTFDRPAVFTPTFILLQDGTEVGRIEGYPGEDFFWGLLGDLIAKQQPRPVGG